MNLEGKVNLKIGANTLKIAKKMKYLGVTLDAKLIRRKYLLELQALLRKLNFLFHHLKSQSRKKNLKKLYHPL